MNFTYQGINFKPRARVLSLASGVGPRKATGLGELLGKPVLSLKGSDGSPLAAHVRPLLGWEVIREEQLSRVLGNMEDVLGTLEDDVFPGAIIPMVMNREMHYYAVAPTQAQQQRLLALLRASIGRTITDFSGQLVQFDAGYGLEALLTQNGYPSGFRFSNGSDAKRDNTR